MLNETAVAKRLFDAAFVVSANITVDSPPEVFQHDITLVSWIDQLVPSPYARSQAQKPCWHACAPSAASCRLTSSSAGMKPMPATKHKNFLDSNVVLNLLSGEESKADRAEALLKTSPLISVQVLNEVTHVCLRKLKMNWDEIKQFLELVRGSARWCH